MESSVLFRTVLLLICILSSTFCSDLNKPIFSTKTPYFGSGSKEINSSIEIDEGSWFEDKESGLSCQIFHLNAVIRHGIRYPGLKWIVKMSEVHDQLKNLEFIKNNPDLHFITTWTNPFPEELQHELTDSGREEQMQLGRRFAQNYGLLWEGDLHRVKFFTSSKSRYKRIARLVLFIRDSRF